MSTKHSSSRATAPLKHSSSIALAREVRSQKLEERHNGLCLSQAPLLENVALSSRDELAARIAKRQLSHLDALELAGCRDCRDVVFTALRLAARDVLEAA